MTQSDQSLLEAALAVLNTPEPAAKVAAARHACARLDEDAPLGDISAVSLPDRPARPALPRLAPANEVPKRRLGSAAGRAALLHAVAHIEFNAIDLAFDMAARFGGDIVARGLDPNRFVRDWVRIGGEEAYHFQLIQDRLAAMSTVYGDLPAHDGLWEAALGTRHSLAARLVVAPLILEARGLDVTPGMIDKLEKAGDQDSASTLKIIYQDEIGHVACGKLWFHDVCKADGVDPAVSFRSLKETYFAGALKPPFNHEARGLAGLPRAFYEPN